MRIKIILQEVLFFYLKSVYICQINTSCIFVEKDRVYSIDNQKIKKDNP